MDGIKNIVKDVNSQVTSAEKILGATLTRADAYEKVQPAAWISRVPEEQLYAQAQHIDERIARGESLALAGVPVAVKDNIDVAGVATTAACPSFSYRAATSAPVIERLIEAGALVLGKTNLDQFATGLVGTRSPYGTVGCVFNRDYVSGGSSSGSAVLVAAGVVPLALGSDTAGSGRVPAAFNHLIGFKPTRGRWSSRGLVPACRTLDCVTSLTTSVEDAVLADSVIAGFDAQDPYARRAPSASPAAKSQLRVGVAKSGELGDLAAPDEQVYRSALGRLRAAGVMLIEIDVAPLLAAARLLYEGPWVAERTAVLQTLLASNPTAIHPVVRTIIQAGKGISAVDTFRGLYALQEHVRKAEELWEQIDVLALPTTPTIYRREEVLAEPYALNANLGRYTNFVNLLDMCAVAVPAGFRDNGTGIGLSLIGPAWSDALLLQLAARYTRVAAPYETPRLDRREEPARVRVAVVGAHLQGMPLHTQLTSRAARFVCSTRTAPLYRLFALQGQTPAKPGLVHIGEGGQRIDLEIYELDLPAFGGFVADVPAPLAIGTVALEDGASVHGFVCEPRALSGALDITAHGGWRAYLAHSKGCS